MNRPIILGGFFCFGMTVFSDDLFWVMGLEVLLKIIIVMVFCRKGKCSVWAAKGVIKCLQKKFTASRWKPVHVSDGVADGVLQHSLFENQVQSFSGTQRTDSQPALSKRRQTKAQRPSSQGRYWCLKKWHRWNAHQIGHESLVLLLQCRLWEDVAL